MVRFYITEQYVRHDVFFMHAIICIIPLVVNYVDLE